MKNPSKDGALSPKEDYKRLRQLSCEALWDEEVPVFDRAEGRERLARVAVVRAVGVVFSESGTPARKEQARNWLLGLLRDPEEKIRRYAMAALPKIGAAVREEAEVIEVLKRSASDREKRHVGRALEKIGGRAAKEAVTGDPSLDRAVQKASANLEREKGGGVTLDGELRDAAGVRIHLRCRSGLEGIVENEVRHEGGKFRFLERRAGLVVVTPHRAFTLGDVYRLRCFSSAAIVLGEVAHAGDALPIEQWADVIASPLSRRVLETFSSGAIRYRLEFVSRGHRRGAVRAVTDAVYARCPALLNDSRGAPWQIDIRVTPRGSLVELMPRLRPDPRFAWRRGDVPAASHPPLAACMARLAGCTKDEVVWDPFCGSGLELIERALQGDVRQVIGSDRSEEALMIARENFAAALGGKVPAVFACGDFRERPVPETFADGGVTLVVSNPPMGRRVPIPDLKELIADFFVTAAAVLRPGGRLVLANPLAVEPDPRWLRREFRQRIDLGGFHVHLEKYRRLPR